MNGQNKVFLIGNVGKEPEIKQTSAETKVATFSLATAESYKDKAGEWKESTTWHNIVAWRTLAGTAQRFLKKGTTVSIEGKINNRSYDDKDGVKKYISEIVADRIIPLHNYKEKTETQAAEASDQGPQGPEPSDDLPF